MPSFLSDENFNRRVLRGLLRRLPALDLASAKDAGLLQTDDRLILAWCAARDRILLTHDEITMVPYAYERVAAGKSMPGVIMVKNQLPVGRTIDELEVMIECSIDDEWRDQVRYIPISS